MRVNFTLVCINSFTRFSSVVVCCRLYKANDTDTSRVFPSIFAAHFAQTVCQDSPLWFFEQHPVKTGQALEAWEAEDFAGKTSGKSVEKSREEAIFSQMSFL
jgi:hypothetical protein